MFDTFSGNPIPGEKDYTIPNNKTNINYTNSQIIDVCVSHRLNHNGKNLCEETLENVKFNINKTNYPKEYLHFIEGNVMETLKIWLLKFGKCSFANRLLRLRDLRCIAKRAMDNELEPSGKRQRETD